MTEPVLLEHQHSAEAAVLDAPDPPDRGAVPALRRMRIGAAAALGLACSGQFVLSLTHDGDSREALLQLIGGGMLIAALAVFGALVRHASPAAPRFEFPIEPASPPRLEWCSRWAGGWLGASLALSLIAIYLFARDGETPAIVLSWLVSIGALAVAQLRSVPVARPRPIGSEWPYLAVLAALLLIALITRTYRLTTLPFNVDGDFADVGLQARALATGEQQHIFAYGWAAVPILGYLPPWLTMQLFGTGLAGLNASGVAEGLLVIAGVYLLGRDLFHARVGLIAAALLTISYTHLAASRQSSYIDPVACMVYSLYFLLIGLREGRGWAAVLSGVLAALCVQMYYSGRLVVPIVGLMLVFLLLFRRPWLRARWWLVAIWALAVAVTLGPMLVLFARDRDGLISRTRDVFILHPAVITHEQGVYHVQTLSGVLAQQARRAALLFHYYPDTGTQFRLDRPFFDPFSASLFTLGLGYALWQCRRFAIALVLGWLALGVTVGCFLTANPPFWPRLMVLLPPAALLAALAVDQLYRLAQISARRAALPMAVALALLLVGVGIINWNTYVEAKQHYITPRTRIARFLADQPASTQAYLLSNELKPGDREFAFLIPGRLIGNLSPEQLEPQIASAGAPTLVIVTPEHADRVQDLLRRFPQFRAEPHSGDAPDDIVFYVVWLS